MGACDYLAKPIQGRSLSNRVTVIFTRLTQRPRGPVVGPAVEPLRVKLEELESGGASGTIALQRGSLAARIVVVEGALQAAECGSLRDTDALNEIASYGDWQLGFDGGAPTASAPTQRQRRITDQTRPAVPGKPFKHVDASLAATVMDEALAQPRTPPPPPRLEPEPEFPDFSEDERTIIDPRERMLEAITEESGQAALDEAIATADLLASGDLDATAAMDEEEIAAAEKAIAAEAALPPDELPPEPPLEGEPTGDGPMLTPAKSPRLAPVPSADLDAVPAGEELTSARLTERPAKDPTGEQLTVGRISRASALGRPPVEVPTAAGPAGRLAAAGAPRIEKPRLEMPTVDDLPADEAAAGEPPVGAMPRPEPTAEDLELGRMDAEVAPRFDAPDAPGLSEPGFGFDEEMPTAMNFKADLDDPSFSRVPLAEVRVTLPLPDVERNGAVPFLPPGGVGAPDLPGGAPMRRGDLQSWLAAQPSPLLVVGPPTEFRETLQAAVEQLGFDVSAVSTGLDAYTTRCARRLS